MDRFNTNNFFNYLNEHIKKIKAAAEIVAEEKYVDFMGLKNTFHLSETKTFNLIKDLIDCKIAEWIILENQFMIEIVSKSDFIAFMCNSRRFETQVMYLDLCGKVTVEKLQEIFNLSPVHAQFLYKNLLTEEDCLKKISSHDYAIKNIDKTIAQIGYSMNVFNHNRCAV